jgi:hypothetical protein
MATCGHSEFIKIPPTLGFLTKTFPRIKPDSTIDRTVPRCRLCDLIAAQQREDEAVSETYTRPIRETEKDIRNTQDLISRDIGKEYKDELEPLLAQMRKRLDQAFRTREAKIAEAWIRHFAIWGPGEGPDLPNEVFVEGDEKPENQDQR